MRRQLHRVGRVYRRHRDDHGNRRPQVHRRWAHCRRRGSCRRRRGVRPLVHLDRGHPHRDGAPRAVAHDRERRRRAWGACCRATHPGAAHRVAARLAEGPVDAGSAGRPAARSRTGCCRRAGRVALAWVQARDAALRERVPDVPGSWEARWPQGPWQSRWPQGPWAGAPGQVARAELRPGGLQPLLSRERPSPARWRCRRPEPFRPHRCRPALPGRACRRRRTHAAAARPVLPRLRRLI
jgi:hypothetical protein